jgi:hypothetical protein
MARQKEEADFRAVEQVHISGGGEFLLGLLDGREVIMRSRQGERLPPAETGTVTFCSLSSEIPIASPEQMQHHKL